LADTFCALGWTQLTVWPSGETSICCPYEGRITDENGKPFSVYSHALDDIWNSADMRGIRRDMLQGEPISACNLCYQQESLGQISIRKSSNADWADGWLNPRRISLETLTAESASAEYRVPAVRFVQLNVGNQCNLKCRMCDGVSSSRIALDEVHTKWTGVSFPLVSENLHWWQRPDRIRAILQHPHELDQLTIVGGEPLIIRELTDVLGHLVESGAAPKITLSVTTNGTTTHSPWLPLVQMFRVFHLYVSIDGYGPTYEYIRYPARWSTLEKNLDVFKKMRKTALSTSITLQAYNVLDIVTLFRFLDSRNMPFCVFNLEAPVPLSTKVLPPAARRLAASRLREYADSDCRPGQKDIVRSLATGLESLGDQWNPQLVRRFMLFTNDLDRSRKQSIYDACPELVRLIAEAGISWTNDIVHSANGMESSGCASVPRAPEIVPPFAREPKYTDAIEHG
jgi:MoaA/NifB/PqqE/SkfB family radical SAM enzyme